MIETLQRPGFTCEPLNLPTQGVRRAVRRRAHHFQGNGNSLPDAPGFVDDTHRAAAQLAEDLVVAKGRLRHTDSPRWPDRTRALPCRLGVRLAGAEQGDGNTPCIGAGNPHGRSVPASAGRLRRLPEDHGLEEEHGGEDDPPRLG